MQDGIICSSGRVSSEPQNLIFPHVYALENYCYAVWTKIGDIWPFVVGNIPAKDSNKANEENPRTAHMKMGSCPYSLGAFLRCMGANHMIFTSNLLLV